MKVKDFMITDVHTVTESTTLRDLLKLLREHEIGGVPVVDEVNHLVGMVSDGDVIRYLAPKPDLVHDLFYTVYVETGEKEKDVLAEKVDTPVSKMLKKGRVYFVKPDDEFEKVIRLLSKHHFKKLPVLDQDKKVIGVISRGDIIKNLTNFIVGN